MWRYIGIVNASIMLIYVFFFFITHETNSISYYLHTNFTFAVILTLLLIIQLITFWKYFLFEPTLYTQLGFVFVVIGYSILLFVTDLFIHVLGILIFGIGIIFILYETVDLFPEHVRFFYWFNYGTVFVIFVIGLFFMLYEKNDLFFFFEWCAMILLVTSNIFTFIMNY
jgi:hypothetical protein